MNIFEIIGTDIWKKRRVDETRYDPFLEKLTDFLLHKHGRTTVTRCNGFLRLVQARNYDLLVRLLSTSIYDLSKTDGILRTAIDMGAPSDVVNTLLQYGATDSPIPSDMFDD